MRVWTRRPGTYAGRERDFGEVFEFAGGPRREQLLRLEYLAKFSGKPVKCGQCGSVFAGDFERNRHGQKRHVRRERSIVRDLDNLTHEELRALDDNGRTVRYGEHFMPVISDGLEEVEREEKFLEERAPLNLEKTAASRK